MAVEAKCHSCQVGGIAPLLTTLGQDWNPLGACKICHALVCGHHGQRDGAKRSFRCQPCDATLLQASAATQAAKATAQGGPMDAAQAALDLALRVTDEPLGPDPAAWPGAATLVELSEQRPGYRDSDRRMRFVDFVREEREWLPVLQYAPELEPIWSTLGRLADEGTGEASRSARLALDLFEAAAWIVWRFRLPPDSVGGPIRRVAEEYARR